MVKNPIWLEADQLAIYKDERGDEQGSTEKQLQLSVNRDLRISSQEKVDHCVLTEWFKPQFFTG